MALPWTQRMKQLLTTLCLATVWLSPTIADDTTTTKTDPPAATAVRELGGNARRLAQNNSDWEVEFHLASRQLTDEGLREVAKLDHVASLHLRDTKITGAGLVHLKGMKHLRRLHLERTDVDDEGIANLSGLKNLEYLNLYQTEITDAALQHLEGLTNLQRLYVWQTNVTDDGVAKLAKKLPQLKISRGVDLSSLPTHEEVVEDQPKPKINLEWKPATRVEDAPKSENGANTTVVFENKSGRAVKLYWVTYDNKLQLYATIKVDEVHRQNTYARNSWLISDTDDKPLGYFIVAEELARATIPK